MTAEPEVDQAPAEGARGGGKIHGLLHGPHSTEILVVCSVVTVVLGYLTFRGKSKSAAQAAAAQVSPTGITTGDVAGFDQASVQGLTDQLSTMAQAQAGAFQDFSGALGAEAQAQVDTTAAINKQGQTLTTINTTISALPQQIASKIPAPITLAPPAPAPAPAPGPAGSGPQYVTVRPGDTLSGIAARYPQSWITPGSIGQLNGIANLNLIHPGQNLRIY